jgi:hypothetical protein
MPTHRTLNSHKFSESLSMSSLYRERRRRRLRRLPFGRLVGPPSRRRGLGEALQEGRLCLSWKTVVDCRVDLAGPGSNPGETYV